MGVNLKDIVAQESIDFDGLRNRVIAIDAFNTIYQFLASIRQPDGTPLKDSSGGVTSHLSGLLYRTIRLMKMGIKPVYVFDGKPPELKRKEIMRRREGKKRAREEYEKAIKERRMEDARKFAKRTSRFTPEMMEDSKRLLRGMGVPFVQAPGEGEAQCAHMCIRGDVWAVGSQDYDSLLFGAPRIVRGLTLSGSFELGMIRLDKALKDIGLTRDQLIDLAILVGTDFDPGVKGIGPKKALKIVSEGGLKDIETDFNFDEVRNVFKNHPVTEDYKIEWKRANSDDLIKLLSDEHDFSENRVKKAANDLESWYKESTQKSLDRWF